MAIGQILQFSGASIDKYDAVRAELGWNGEEGKPQGILAHAAGSTAEGFCVVEWWSSEGDWTSSSLRDCDRRSRRSAVFRNRN